ncbi:uncharacterized protein LOC116058730 isoform X2 [Sander lucioperca]|uniref:uncharacterized protein LOC116058730 isoform X2 n=1 Tax=Sander lucioperca TaxID=283035 RepID=UPI001653ECA9|nr:uncharacterized protein LOC116058730 isoform X2 [Sander lucioperca]
MAVAQGPSLAAVLLLVSSGLHCSSLRPPCPESCSCQKAPLLNCSSSGLSLVPQHIQDSVTELDLSHNLLDTVKLNRPHHNLRSVLLGNNSITHLSLCIERNLGSRYVRGRPPHRFRLSRRQGCVSWAPTLQLLSVERNQLEQLPQGLEGSESIQVLQLSFNRISTLRPGELSRLRQLKELHLRHNLITSLHPQMFQDLAQLRVLDLSFNMLTSLHPLIYLSLRNIGADVRLGGNRWQCDCSMRSLRRWLAYDSSRGLQSWSMVCASPSILSGRDLLQLEEDDLNCFGTEKGPELHQDVTVYSGSEILLSCSTQDSVWWMPSGQASVSQPQAGLLISDITERDTGLYVCVSKEHNVLSVFSLQISKIGGARRKTRSLPRTSRQIIPQDTPNRIGQERNQRATQPNLPLAVCLSVFITFLVAFILGVLARPCIDVLWRRVTKKKRSSATNSVSSVEQRHYENGAYYNDEEPEPEHVGTHRERRVTFSTVEDCNVQYYDTIPNLESNNNDAVIECEASEAEKDTNTAGYSGSENSSRRGSLERNQRDDRDLSGGIEAGRTHKIEFEHIPDPVELDRRRLSSCSDSSVSDKIFNEDKMTRGDHLSSKSRQLAEDSVQQRADASTAKKVEGTRELPGFSSEPFTDWSPHVNNTNLTYCDVGQENEEQFEFSDSVRSTSSRSSSVCGSFNDSKFIVAPTTDKQKTDDTSSSISFVSEDEVTQYIVNSDQEEEDIERNDAIKPQWPAQDLGHATPIKRRAPLPPTNSSSSGESAKETMDHMQKQGEMHMTMLPLGVSQNVRLDHPQPQWPALDLERTIRIKRHLDIKAQSTDSDSSSSSDSEGETTHHTKTPGKVDIAGLPFQESQTGSHDPDTRWPALDLKHIPQIKRRLDIKAPSPDLSSSSDSEDETTIHIKKQEQGQMNMARLPSKVSQSVSYDPQTHWPVINPEHTTRVKRRLDIKAPSPASDLSSSSDSEGETTHHTERPGKVDIAGLVFQESQTGSHDPDTRWPALDLKQIPQIKRRLDIKAPSPDLSSSSDSDDETTIHIKKQEQGQMNMARLPSKVSQSVTYNNPQTHWPLLDLEHTTHIKRRLDIKAPSPASDLSSSSDSDDETTHHTETPGKVDIAGLVFQESQTGSHDPDTRWPALDLKHIPQIKRRLDIKAPSPASDLSSSSDSDDETTHHTETPGKVDIAGLVFQESQTGSHDPDTRWPALDLKHIPQIKRRLDIKAPSPPPDLSSSSDSDDETTIHIKKQEQGQMNMARLPSKVSQSVSYDPQTHWPVINPEHTTRVKRRLDIKAPSPASDLSSSSDSDDETTHHTETPGKVDIAGLVFQESQTGSHDPDTRWPALDLKHIPQIKRRLDIKAPSPDLSSSSDSDDETTIHIKKQEQGQMNMARLPSKVSQSVSYDPQTHWPVLDLEHTTHIKRRLDIKAPSPASDLSSSSDSDDETTHHTETPGKVDIAGLVFQESQTGSHDPDTRWPALDLKHIPQIKRRLDIKAPSPDLSSSSDSDDETTHHTERPGKVDIAGLVFQESQTGSHDPDTRWPALDLKHIPQIKRRLDIKAPSPPPDLSSSSDSDDETTIHIKKQEQGQMNMARLPSKVSQTVSYDPQTHWPALDLEHTTHIKRRLDIKAPSPASDLSSSRGSDDETTHHTKKERPGVVGSAGHLFQESQIVSHDPETQWPALDLGNITRIKRRLDIKAPSPPPDSIIIGGSMNHTVEGTTDEAIKISHGQLSNSSIEQEEGMENVRYPPTTVEPDSRWPRLDLSSALYVKRRLNIKICSPPPESSSSSNESEGGTTNLPVKVEKDRTDVGITSYQPGRKLPDMSKATEKEFISLPKTHISRSPKTDHNIKLEKYTVIKEEVGGETRSDTPEINPELQSRWATMNLGVSRFRKRLEITSHTHKPPHLPSSPPPDSPSSSSSESGTRSKSSRIRRKRRGVGMQGIIHTESSQSLTNIPHIRRALDIRAPLQKESSSSNSEDETIDHSGPDLSLGVPRVKRRLDVKAPLPEQSDSPSSCSESESRHASNMSGMTDDDSLITYKRIIMKASSPPNNSIYPSGKGQTIDQTKQRHMGAEMLTVAQEGPFHSVGDRNASLAPKRVPSINFDDVVKKRTEQSRHTTGVDLPPEIRWIGVGRQLSDLSIPSSRRHLDVGLSSPQHASSAEPELSQPVSSNIESDHTKQDRGRADVTLMHKHSSLSSNSVSLASSRPEERIERKGLSALKAMSSLRRKWEPLDENLDKGASPVLDYQDPQSVTSFNYRRSEKDIKPLAKQPLTQLHLSSTSVDERRATDLYDIPRYRRHDIGGIEPPQGAPPPIPATPPPYE